jgi:hypothetical protein
MMRQSPEPFPGWQGGYVPPLSQWPDYLPDYPLRLGVGIPLTNN